MSEDIRKEDLLDHYAIPWESGWLEKVDENLFPLDISYRARMVAVIKMIEASPDSELNILDLGCGVGIYDFNIIKSFPNTSILGVDISTEQIKIAEGIAHKRKVANVRFEPGDIESFKSKEIFSYILCSEIIEHLPDPSKAVNNIANLCQKDTKLIVGVPQTYHGARQEGVFHRQQIEGGEWLHSTNKDNLSKQNTILSYYHTYYNIRKLDDLMELHGFKREKIAWTGLCFPVDLDSYDSQLRVFCRKVQNRSARTLNKIFKNNAKAENLITLIFNGRFAENIIAVYCLK